MNVGGEKSCFMIHIYRHRVLLHAFVLCLYIDTLYINTNFLPKDNSVSHEHYICSRLHKEKKKNKQYKCHPSCKVCIVVAYF